MHPPPLATCLLLSFRLTHISLSLSPFSKNPVAVFPLLPNKKLIANSYIHALFSGDPKPRVGENGYLDDEEKSVEKASGALLSMLENADDPRNKSRYNHSHFPSLLL